MISCCSRACQLVEMLNNLICFTATALVISNGVYQVGGPSVMEEEDALSDTPEGGGSEFVGTRAPCVMPSARLLPMWWTRRSDQRFAVWLESEALGLVEEPLAIIVARGEGRCMALGTAYLCKRARPFSVDGRGRSGSGWRQHPHKVSKRFDVRDDGRV